MKKLISIIAIVLCSILVITIGFTELIKVNEPKISTEFKISHITDKEFESIGTEGLTNPTKEDFRRLKFTLHVSHSDKINFRNINLPDFKTIANSYDDIKRYWFGESSNQDNDTENYANYTVDFVFLSKGLDDQEIKKIFNSESVKITWAANYNEKVLHLGDIIKFE